MKKQIVLTATEKQLALEVIQRWVPSEDEGKVDFNGYIKELSFALHLRCDHEKVAEWLREYWFPAVTEFVETLRPKPLDNTKV